MTDQEKSYQPLLNAVRRVDPLGRLVLPFDVRRTLGIKDGDSLSISIEDGRIILEKVDVTAGK